MSPFILSLIIKEITLIDCNIKYLRNDPIYSDTVFIIKGMTLFARFYFKCIISDKHYRHVVISAM